MARRTNKEQQDRMVDLFMEMRWTDKQISEKVGCTLKQVQYYKWKLGCTNLCRVNRCKYKWNHSTLEKIRKMWKEFHDPQMIAEDLGITEGYLRTRLSQLRKQGIDAPYLYKPTEMLKKIRESKKFV